MGWLSAIGIIVLLIAAVALYDVIQRRHTLMRNFPVIAHFRFWLEAVGPELRQYIVTGNDEERPFSRNQRRWVYASAKRQNNAFGFGTDQHFDSHPDYLVIKHAAFPHRRATPHLQDTRIPCAKVMGGPAGRRAAFRPDSVVNISGMSFGALSGPAVESMNRGARLAGCLHNTGEGGLSVHHRHGGDLIFQIGTGYFGCREPGGRFSLPRLLELVQASPVRAIEIKLSQGAKPGLGGLLPAAKVTREIAEARGVAPGVDIVSPGAHSAFEGVDGMLEFAERLADATGLPVGIKSAVGELAFWEETAARIAATGMTVDFVTVDGGEGGTGAAPLVFADHVALPYVQAQVRVHRIFVAHGVAERIVFIGAGRLGFPETALLAFSLGADMVNVGREAMMATGCIQAQRCHTGGCPTGVATQNRWRTRGIVPEIKGVRVANYISALRGELLSLAHVCGVAHPGLVTVDQFEHLDGVHSRPASAVYGYEPQWGLPAEDDRAAIEELMDRLAAEPVRPA